MRNQKKSKGFTLFEVLISVIIIAIVMSAFPVIFQTMVNADKQVMKEEVFFQEFTILSLVNSRYFDENNTADDNFYKDLNATGGAEALKIVLNTTKLNYVGKYCRKGKCEFNNNILRSGTTYTTSEIGADSGEIKGDTNTYDDIDDFNGYNETILGNVIHVNVKYINDSTDYNEQNMTFNLNYNPSTDFNNTNIKLITVWCKVGDTNITLRYPTSNIGASKFLSLEEISR